MVISICSSRAGKSSKNWSGNFRHPTAFPDSPVSMEPHYF